MGSKNKLLLPFGEKPLIAHIVETVCVAAADEVIVVLGHEADRIRAALSGYDVTFVHNPDFRDGMTTSIQAGLRTTSETAAGFMICLSDLPLIESAAFNHLITAFRQAITQDPRHIIRPVYQNTPGNPVLFPVHYKPDLLGHKDKTGCKEIVLQNRDWLLDIEMPNDHVLRDIDTPDAYENLSPSAE